jgi:hypothetical protein
MRNVANPALLVGLAHGRVALRMAQSRPDQIFERTQADALAIEDRETTLTRLGERSHTLHRPGIG